MPDSSALVAMPNEILERLHYHVRDNFTNRDSKTINFSHKVICMISLLQPIALDIGLDLSSTISAHMHCQCHTTIYKQSSTRDVCGTWTAKKGNNIGDLFGFSGSTKRAHRLDDVRSCWKLFTLCLKHRGSYPGWADRIDAYTQCRVFKSYIEITFSVS